MRNEESAQRITPLVLLKILCVAHHPRGPGIQRVVALEPFCQLLGAVEGQRLCLCAEARKRPVAVRARQHVDRLGWLRRPNHTRFQKDKARREPGFETYTMLLFCNGPSDVGTRTGEFVPLLGLRRFRHREFR